MLTRAWLGMGMAAALASISCSISLPSGPGAGGTGGAAGAGGATGAGGSPGGRSGSAGASGGAGTAGAAGVTGTSGTTGSGGRGVAGTSGGAGASGGAGGLGGAAGTSGTGNRAWGAATMVDSGMSPHVAMGGPRAALVWLFLDQTWIVKARQYQDGTGWDPAVTVEQPMFGSLQTAAAPFVAMNAHGVTLATWKQQGNGEEDAAFDFRLPGGSWSGTTPVSGIDLSVSAGGTSNPVVAIGANDLGQWLIGGQAGIYEADFVQVGTSLPGGYISEPGYSGTCPWVSVNARGAAMAVWIERPSTGQWLEKALYIDPNASQTPPTVTIGTGDPNLLGCPLVAIDDLNRAIAVWTVTSGNVSTLAYRMADMSQSWGAGPASVDTGGLGAFNPSLALSATGEGLIAWEQATSGAASALRDVRAVHFQISVGLDAAGAVGVGSTAPAAVPHVVVTGPQAGVAVWIQANHLWSSPYLSGGWQPAAAIDGVRTGTTSQNPDLATDRAGRALAVWESTAGGIPDIMVARFE